MSVFDPSSLIDARVRDELAPLQAQLDAASDPKERRSIARQMARREQQLRSALSGNPIAW